VIIRPTRSGTYRVQVLGWQQSMLTNLVDQLRDLLLDGSSPLLRRLFPTAYPSDAEADAAYADLVGDQLLAAKLDALDTVEATIEGGEFTEEQLIGWMQAVNSLRLVLGTRLDVSEDLDPGDVADDDPDKALWVSYELLTQMLAIIVDALED
jgi:hypothetical protein